MIINDLPCLEQLNGCEIRGGGKHTYTNSVAHTFVSSHVEKMDLSKFLDKYASRFRISVITDKHSHHHTSTVAKVSVHVETDSTKTYSTAAVYGSAH